MPSKIKVNYPRENMCFGILVFSRVRGKPLVSSFNFVPININVNPSHTKKMTAKYVAVLLSNQQFAGLNIS